MRYIKVICKNNLEFIDEEGEYAVAYYKNRMYSFLVENEDSYIGFDEIDCKEHKLDKKYMDKYFDVKCILKYRDE